MKKKLGQANIFNNKLSQLTEKFSKVNSLNLIVAWCSGAGVEGKSNEGRKMWQ